MYNKCIKDFFHVAVVCVCMCDADGTSGSMLAVSYWQLESVGRNDLLFVTSAVAENYYMHFVNVTSADCLICLANL